MGGFGITGFETSVAIADNSVTTAKIVNLAVTTAKIDDLAVTTGKINDLAVTTGKIAAGAVTPAKLAALGQQVSSSSGNYSTTSTLETDITNLTVTITTTGRPVVIELIPDGTTNYGYLSASTASLATTSAQFIMYRDSTKIGYFYVQDIGAAAAHGVAVPNSSIRFIDVVAAGTYVYKLRGLVSNSSMTLGCAYAVMVAYEL